MFPWNIEDLGRIVVGRPLLPIFQEIVQKESGLNIGRSILEKLRAAETNFYPKTIKRFNLDYPIDVIRSTPFQGIRESPRSYGQFFDVASQLMQQFAEDPRAKPTNLLHQSIREIFPQTIASILWVEDWWITLCEEQRSVKINDPDGPFTSLPVEVFQNIPASRSESERRSATGMLIEQHAFMLYLAAYEEDVANMRGTVMAPRAGAFVPTEQEGSIRYPMWRFWRWFADKADCETWGELAKKADFNKTDSPDGAEGEQVVRNWANAKPPLGDWSAANCKMISWKRLRQVLAKLEGQLDPCSAFKLEIQWGYGLARILQEHAARCLPVIEEFVSPELPLKSFYQDRIEACKQNECRRIPPAPIDLP